MNHSRNSKPPTLHIPLAFAVRLALITGTGAVSITPCAWAAPGGEPQSLEEVVVTATRRESSILDIPYSISAVSSATLAANNVRSLSDLTKLVPGISFVDQGPTSRSNFVLRGINANATDQPSFSTVAPVSTYIGETPLFLSLHIDDIDRVEVLRGPQGTLYGSGSLAGTIRFIPKKPDPSAFSASIEADAADVNTTNQYNRSFAGMVNLPVNDVAAFRLSGGYQHYAGFINENYIVKLGPPSTAVHSPVGVPVSGNPNDPIFGPLSFAPVRDANTSDLWQARASFLFKPRDNFSVLASYYHQDDKSQGEQAVSPYFSGNVDFAPADNPFYKPSYPVSNPTGGVVFPHNGTYDLNNSFLLLARRQADLASADVSYGFGFATVTSSTSYYRDRGNDVADGTSFIATHPSFYGFLPRAVDYETDYDQLKGFVEEVRLVSDSGQHPIDYVVGLFFQHLEGSNGQTQSVPGQTYYSNLATGYPGSSPDTFGDTNFIVANTTDFKDRALFGELTWHATSQWQITGGARFFKQSFSTTSFSALPYCGVYCGTGAEGVTYVPPNGYSVNDHIFKLNTSYKVNDGLNAYINYAEGFRRGGANGIPLAGPFAVNPALQVYTPDKTKNYEAGAKGKFLGVNYTFDYFYINWNNFQLDTQAYAGGYSLAANGAKARSRGVELSLDGQITSQWDYQFGYTFTKAEVAQDFAIKDNLDDGSGGFASIVTAKDGDALPNAPQHSATLGVNYSHAAPFLDDWKMRWHVNGSYRSSTLSRLVNTAPGARPPFEIQGFAVWDASIALVNNHGLTTSLYGQNLFNALAVTGGLDAGEAGVGPGGVRASHYFVGRPRTIGVRIGYKF